MKTFSISISSCDWSRLRQLLFTADGNENAAVLLCGIAETDYDRRLLVRTICEVSGEEYTERLPYHLEVSPRFYNNVVNECLAKHLTPVIVHSHPFAEEARYSPSDDYGESRLLPILESLLPGTTPASLVIAPTRLAGRRFLDGDFVLIDFLKIAGVPSRTVPLRLQQKRKHTTISPQFDRQVLSFGAEGQRLLQQIKVGIIGIGGTGSLVAEQLARVGVRDFILVDPDDVEVSNVSRLFGVGLKQVGKQKVKVVGTHIQKLGASHVTTITDSALKQKVLLKLRDRDVVFGCVDNDRARAVLSRFSHQYLIPLIDLGIRLDGRGGSVKAAAGRVTVVGNGLTCLRCSHHLNPERIRAESLSIKERQTLEREGYIMGIDEPAPAIVSLNATIAGLGVTAALNLFLGLTGGTQPVNQLYDATSGTIFTTAAVHQKGCDVCDDEQGVKALGDAQIVSAYD